jgi:hypothetical protein
MVVRAASQPDGYVPSARPSIAVAGDGTLVAIREAGRITIAELPSARAFAEIRIDPDAVESDVGWLGSPPRLLVISRYAQTSVAHLLDPRGPHTLAELQLESAVRLLAVVGGSALVVGSAHAGVLTAGDAQLSPYPFPSRRIPLAAGAAAGQFVVALSGSIEQWDPHSRIAKRRIRLARTAPIAAIGGSERVVWMTTLHEPARVHVIPLVNRGQPTLHDLPEPIAELASHPRSERLACLGSETGRLYLIDLDGRAPLATVEVEGMARIASAGLISGPARGPDAAGSAPRLVEGPGLVVAQAGCALAIARFR